MNDDDNNFQRFFIAKHRNFLRGICHPWHIRSYTDSIIFAKFHARKEENVVLCGQRFVEHETS